MRNQAIRSQEEQQVVIERPQRPNISSKTLRTEINARRTLHLQSERFKLKATVLVLILASIWLMIYVYQALSL